MNNMLVYSKYVILSSMILLLSIFTIFSISEVQAAENIFVDAKSFENTIIIEFKNEEGNTSNIKTIRMWLAPDNSFKSFKSEPGWSAAKNPDGQLLVFTATNPLKPGESVKFGVITDKKASGITWKILDQNENQIDTGNTLSQEISQTSPVIEEDAKMIEETKETAGSLYGTKKFIPEKLRVDSNVRLVASGFNSEQTLQFYLDNISLKSVKTDKQGNFITTLHIPSNINPGTSEFIIKNEFGDLQSTSVNISESKNRFLQQVTEFEITEIPREVRLEDTLSISGNGPPLTQIILSINNEQDVLETIRVVDINANGKWSFEELMTTDQIIGTKTYLLKNGVKHILREVELKSDKLLSISTAATRYNAGDTVIFTGNGIPNKDLTLFVKDPDGKIIHFDIIKIGSDGGIQYEFTTDTAFETGTYVLITKHQNESDAHLFGIGQYPTTQIVVLTDKTNYIGTGSSAAFLNIVGPPSTSLLLTIIDPSDNSKFSDTITTNSAGEHRYELDLSGYTTGVYKAVVSKANIQDSTKFAVGVQSGSGDISLTPPKQSYLPGEQLVISGQTEHSDSILTASLIDPSGNTVSKIEIFSDNSGSFSTDLLGIPTTAELGDWKIIINSKLDTAENTMTVSMSTGVILSLDITKTEYEIGETVVIKGTAPTVVSYVIIIIANSSQETIEELETPLTGNGNFSLPWIVPADLPFGFYTIQVSDNTNTSSIQIDIQ